MTATFESIDYGKIEVTRAANFGSWKGTAYFFSSDAESDVCENGRFRDLDGREFQVTWPWKPEGEASLTVYTPRTIGTVQVTRS
jgi:hypothetical protein